MIQAEDRQPEPTTKGASVQQQRGPAGSPDGRSQAEAQEQLAHRVDRLEAQVTSLIDALRALAHGLEAAPGAAADERRVSHAARQAYELLLAAPGSARTA
jgi:hypothetical protein